MAINKRAKNIRIKVRNNYTSVSGKVTKVAEQINVEARNNDLTLVSNKKVIAQGNIEGGSYDAIQNNIVDSGSSSSPKAGYYYKEDGTFLGKIDNNENVYITDKTTFEKIKNKEDVNASLIIAFTEKYKLNNNDVLNRANWAYGEGGGFVIERYVMTIENLKQSGVTGYGPKPFGSEETMYRRSMLHGNPAKCLYPQYFDGKTFGAPVIKNGKIIRYENNAYKFAKARKSPSYSELNNNPAMKLAISSVLKSLRGLIKNEGYNNWRGSGDTLYTVEQKNNFTKEFKQPKDKDLKRTDGKVYAKIITTIDHYWEPVGKQFRRHTFHKMKKQNSK